MAVKCDDKRFYCVYFQTMCRYKTQIDALRKAYIRGKTQLLERWLFMAPDEVISEYEFFRKENEQV